MGCDRARDQERRRRKPADQTQRAGVIGAGVVRVQNEARGDVERALTLVQRPGMEAPEDDRVQGGARLREMAREQRHGAGEHGAWVECAGRGRNGQRRPVAQPRQSARNAGRERRFGQDGDVRRKNAGRQRVADLEPCRPILRQRDYADRTRTTCGDQRGVTLRTRRGLIIALRPDDDGATGEFAQACGEFRILLGGAAFGERDLREPMQVQCAAAGRAERALAIDEEHTKLAPDREVIQAERVERKLVGEVRNRLNLRHKQMCRI